LFVEHVVLPAVLPANDPGREVFSDMPELYLLGVDIGSTTVKVALVDPRTDEVVYHRYMRHGARQRETALRLIREMGLAVPGARVLASFTGSGSRDVAEGVGLGHIQEVVANSVAVRRFHPETRVAIELGGQDAKVIFFHADSATGDLQASDMRMNGSCAGGTGAFIDEVAKLLQTPVEQFDDLAAQGERVYQISGRCGVFAKTDIQPLLNQGVARSDLALSTFHAVARQTIGGLAQGLQIRPPVIFQGGPLTFNHTLLRVFAERLNLVGTEVIRPDQPEIFVAHGAALAVPVIFPDTPELPLDELVDRLVAANDAVQVRAGSIRPPGPVAADASAPHGDRTTAGDGVTASDGRADSDATGVPGAADAVPPLFADAAERSAFDERHRRPDHQRATFPPGSVVPVYIGIDAGSTTTKMVLLDEEGALLDAAYSHNEGDPLRTGAGMLAHLLERYEGEGVSMPIRGLGTTGYGERLFATAFRADYHTVETVAHAHAALTEAPDASFVLDIGGQDMKAITIADGIVTGISLNEACSAGCGSFLENFASTLQVPVERIAPLAFASSEPSRLGSRCTVFMNSSIITEQKNGKSPEDILAGLCRSIIENVFTKVVRVPNFSMLGDTVVVQGGTFENDAVLRALEQYTDRRVVRASFPGLMGAIGVALLARDAQLRKATAGDSATPVSQFRGLPDLEGFDFEQESGVVCPFCSNACNRTVIRFADGARFVTGNRCERGEILEAPTDAAGREQLREITRRRAAVPNLMAERETLYMRDFVVEPLREATGVRIGIPRVLEFWNSLPFWRSLWKSLGYEVVLSGASSRDLFEEGLSSVPSDTVCFPAKLAHGHMKDLFARKVDRIFMPMINRMPPENPTTTSNHVCAVVKGYPMVIDVSDEPLGQHGIPFDRPMFHAVDDRTRRRQIGEWVSRTFDIEPQVVAEAIRRSDAVQREVEESLRARALDVLTELEGTDRFAVVLAGRPYHTDPLVNHDLASFFVDQGIPVLTVDSLPGLNDVDLSRTRAELTVNFHVRMYAAALQVAAHPNLELIQMVSFGCGHDAIISDEVVRLMEQSSNKTPLTLKLDETDVRGPLAIRVRSFIETVTARRERIARARGAVQPAAGGSAPEDDPTTHRQLPDPFPVKFVRGDRHEKVIMAPNVSRAFAQVISAAIRKEGYRIEPLPMADRRAIELGKRYIHNDMCFPAQVNVGEMLRALETGFVDPDHAVCGLAKSQCDCRLAHYAGLARRALDDAGYPQVPIITTDNDTKNMHPGFSLSPLFELRMLWSLAMIDALETLRLRLRPYEAERGAVDRVFEDGVEMIAAGIETSISRAVGAYRRAVAALTALPLTEGPRRPQVFVIGEFLLNFHPTSNFDIVRYLEANGMEVLLPNILDSFRRDFMRMKTERKEFYLRYPFMDTVLSTITDTLFDHVLSRINEIAGTHPLFEERVPLPEIAHLSEEIVHHTFTSGEGWMIAGEILHHAAHGIRSFLILQPFGCLPNHVTGRGLVKRLKEIHPDAQILSLDYDPDTSFANIENRLQMLILNARLQVTKTATATK
jgi:predicted CoA-substrate-specific enzyme activase